MVSGRDFACHMVKNTGQEAGGKVVQVKLKADSRWTVVPGTSHQANTGVNRIMFCHSILMKYSDEYFLSEEATEILS